MYMTRDQHWLLALSLSWTQQLEWVFGWLAPPPTIASAFPQWFTNCTWTSVSEMSESQSQDYIWWEMSVDCWLSAYHWSQAISKPSELNGWLAPPPTNAMLTDLQIVLELLSDVWNVSKTAIKLRVHIYMLVAILSVLQLNIRSMPLSWSTYESCSVIENHQSPAMIVRTGWKFPMFCKYFDAQTSAAIETH